MISKIRSAPARAASKALNCWEIWVMGWEKDRVYWRKEAMEPMSIRPLMTSMAPTAAVRA